MTSPISTCSRCRDVSNKAALQNAQGNLDSAKGKYLGAQAELSYTEIRSPIDGVITDRPLFAGETAAAGAALVTVMDTSALIAKLHIAQVQAQQLALGAPATLTVPGVEQPVPAKVSLISPALDPGSTTVEVWLRVENAKGRAQGGNAGPRIHPGPYRLQRAHRARGGDPEQPGRKQQVCSGDCAGLHRAQESGHARNSERG